MSALSVGVRRRSPWVVAGAALASVVVAATWACSASGGGAAQQAADAPIGVRTSDMFVTLENRAGLPLVDVDVTILPIGTPTAFTKSVSRMENGEKRDFPLGNFTAQDRTTTFSLRLVRPKSVRVKARDLVGKAYEVTVAW